MGPLVILLLGGTAIALVKKSIDPDWSPISSALATPSDLRAALARVRETSVPTPDATAGLDPNMTTKHVEAANVMLAAETSAKRLFAFAKNAVSLGFHNTAHAAVAKADAIADAKAAGAKDHDIAASQPVDAATTTTVTGFDLFAHGIPAGGSRPGWGGTSQAQHDHDVALAKAKAAAAAKKQGHNDAYHGNYPKSGQQQQGGGYGYGGMGGMGGGMGGGGMPWHPHPHHHHHHYQMPMIDPSMMGGMGMGGALGGGDIDESIGLGEDED